MALRSGRLAGRAAARNRRGEADLIAAVRGAGLSVDRDQLEDALGLLCSSGCVENLVPLSDGDLLLTVTGLKV